jgi:hypothetical protein
MQPIGERLKRGASHLFAVFLIVAGLSMGIANPPSNETTVKATCNAFPCPCVTFDVGCTAGCDIRQHCIFEYGFCENQGWVQCTYWYCSPYCGT